MPVTPSLRIPTAWCLRKCSLNKISLLALWQSSPVIQRRHLKASLRVLLFFSAFLLSGIRMELGVCREGLWARPGIIL